MKPIQLRDYQIESVEKLRDGIRRGLRRQILVAPTAFGKTECAAFIIQQSQVKGATAWFIVDRITLLDQTSERFAGYGIDHGIIQADHWLTDPRKPVQICSAQTVINRQGLPFPDLIVIDEAHCEFRKIVEMVEAAGRSKVIGLTATPFTAGMAQHWDGVVNGATVNHLLNKGFLTPLKIKACVTPDMKGARKKFTGEYDDDDAGQRGITIIGDVVQTWISQTAKFFGGPVKTIVFSPSVKHGEELCRQFADAGFNFQQISYLDASDKERRDKIEELRKPDSAIHGLVSCAVLTKGFDVPDVLCGISCRPYAKSFSSHIQELGRVMRIAPDKQFGLWLDHTGNCISFAEDTAWLFEHGVDSLSDAQKKDSETREPVERIKQKYFCGDCGLQMEGASDVCAGCGWQRPRRGEIKTVEGELVDVEVSILSAYQPRAGLRADCIKNPRAVWNAALCYCWEHSRKDPETIRKWAYAIWRAIYPNSKLPHGLWDIAPSYKIVAPDEISLIEREVRRNRQTMRRRAA
ncbi:DEAD/DEAH box helicase [Kumtagia ephedrae]|uniref:DEAD/DEAH box helicase n=1 Tax=Kumtagia ephedrae TaxID=2116701 RepID=A0A2P7SPW0_9HYPH|nr:DEAD/DEAH box helicase family protein [Mesorhizobium ephedrae]PSJ64487.1 DEAD/DEAH box helicase [Mesorhizobium ephedrae]